MTTMYFGIDETFSKNHEILILVFSYTLIQNEISNNPNVIKGGPIQTQNPNQYFFHIARMDNGQTLKQITQNCIHYLENKYKRENLVFIMDGEDLKIELSNKKNIIGNCICGDKKIPLINAADQIAWYLRSTFFKNKCLNEKYSISNIKSKQIIL